MLQEYFLIPTVLNILEDSQTYYYIFFFFFLKYLAIITFLELG